jgi:RNA polymerase sigma factor (sigma-70 family)
VAHDLPDPYAARRAALEAQFAALPLVGTLAYWQAIERTDGADTLPLEVLARCVRERHTHAVVDAERVYAIIMRRIDPAVRRWAVEVTHKSPSGRRSELEMDLAQESFWELWQELISKGPTFLLENFAFAFSRIRQHVAMDVMQRAGEWTRRGVLRPSRIPRGHMLSLEAERAGEHEMPLADTLADPNAQRPFDLVDASDLLAEVRLLPPSERMIVLHLICGGMTQAEVATMLGVTDRTVRNQVTRIVTKLRRLYLGLEEDNHA